MSDSSERPIVNLVGERVALGPFTLDAFNLHVRWVNDWAAQATLASSPLGPRTPETEAAWWEHVTRGERDRGFVIYAREPFVPIGTVCLTGIDYHNQRAGLGILIGEREYRAPPRRAGVRHRAHGHPRHRVRGGGAAGHAAVARARRDPN